MLYRTVQGFGNCEDRNSEPGMLHHIFLYAPHVPVAAFSSQRESFYKSPAQVTYEFLQLGFVEVLLVKDIPGVNVAYLGDFLFQCHPSEKVGGTFLGRECGVFIGLCLQG